MLISSILLAVAGFSNAVMDTTRDHYRKSIFSEKPFAKAGFSTMYRALFWTNYGWENKYKEAIEKNGRRKLFPNKSGLLGAINYPVQITDAWHLFKTIMIICYCLALVLYKPLFGWFPDLCLAGFIVNTSFSLFYNKLLIKK